MSIIDNITGNLLQNVVYWAPTTPTGYGADTFVAGVDLNGRWEEVQEKVINMNGEEAVSKVRCFIDDDVAEGGYLWLGSTDDSDYNADPGNVPDAQRIIAFKKISRLNSPTEYLRQANCNMGGNAIV